MKRLFLILGYLLTPLLTLNANAQSFVAYDQFIVKQTNLYNIPLPKFWISHIYTANDGIRHRGGQLITNIPDTVSAFYDPTIKHDIKHFYQAQNHKLSVITGLSPSTRWGIFTIGYDNGHKSQKLTIDKAYLLGYTNQFALSRNLSLLVSGYSWIGGDITERPCLDSFDREFACLTLQPMSE